MEHYLKDTTNHQVVIFEGTVYDVKEYAPDHPGGDHYLTERLGKNIEQDFEDAEHTKSARNVMRDLPIVGTVNSSDSASTSSQGSQVNTEKFHGAQALYGLKLEDKLNEKIDIDYNKPLMWQLLYTNFTFNEYVTYINEPKHLVNPVRDIILFENTFLETVSRAKYWHILVAHIPIEIFCIYNMYEYNFSFNPLHIFLCMFAGLMSWTIAEYLVHRFIFHCEDTWLPYLPHNSYVFTAHFTLHGIHHAFPQDRERIVFPPIPGQLLIFYPFIYSPLRNRLSDEYFYNF